jgi:hypothetical protein
MVLRSGDDWLRDEQVAVFTQVHDGSSRISNTSSFKAVLRPSDNEMKCCCLVLFTMCFLLPLLSCSTRDGAPLDREQKAIERTMPTGARILSTSKSRRSSGAIDVSWEYALPSDLDSTRKVLRNAFQNGYQFANTLSLARFDGNDSFHLSFSLKTHRSDDRDQASSGTSERR